MAPLGGAGRVGGSLLLLGKPGVGGRKGGVMLWEGLWE